MTKPLAKISVLVSFGAEHQCIVPRAAHACTRTLSSRHVPGAAGLPRTHVHLVRTPRACMHCVRCRRGLQEATLDLSLNPTSDPNPNPNLILTVARCSGSRVSRRPRSSCVAASSSVAPRCTAPPPQAGAHAPTTLHLHRWHPRTPPHAPARPGTPPHAPARPRTPRHAAACPRSRASTKLVLLAFTAIAPDGTSGACSS